MPGGWSQEGTFGLGHEQLVASYGKIRGRVFKIKGNRQGKFLQAWQVKEQKEH